MARPRLFTDDDVLDAALRAVAAHGSGATIAHISDAMGAPVGSIYYRFPTRAHVLIGLWLRCIARFQAGILEVAGGANAQRALEACARHVVRYCAEHQDEARGLTLFRQERLLLDCPDDLREAVAGMNKEVFAAMAELTARRFGSADPEHVELVRTAVQLAPYGLVRPFIGMVVPPVIEEAAVVAARAILTLGDG